MNNFLTQNLSAPQIYSIAETPNLPLVICSPWDFSSLNCLCAMAEALGPGHSPLQRVEALKTFHSVLLTVDLYPLNLHSGTKILFFPQPQRVSSSFKIVNLGKCQGLLSSEACLSNQFTWFVATFQTHSTVSAEMGRMNTVSSLEDHRLICRDTFRKKLY